MATTSQTSPYDEALNATLEGIVSAFGDAIEGRMTDARQQIGDAIMALICAARNDGAWGMRKVTLGLLHDENITHAHLVTSLENWDWMQTLAMDPEAVVAVLTERMPIEPNGDELG